MKRGAFRCRLGWLAMIFAFAPAAAALAQQVADLDFKPPIPRPAFAAGSGPVVALDEAHFNFHTLAGRYAPFGDLLRRDGFTVRAGTARFSPASLTGIRVLVIANALHRRNGSGDWSLPTPSAFTPEEITAVKGWVANGGALLLIVDHMPFSGCNHDLAAAFGFTFSNGFAQDAGGDRNLIYRRANGTLPDHPILHGRFPAEQVDTVATFTGSAFQIPDVATSLFTLPPGSLSLEPKIAWQFDPATKRTDVAGWSQGAVMKPGRGRLAVFGEAAMFSAQLAGPQKRRMGMNAPEAKQNAQFLLNVLHWLAGVTD